MCKTYTNNVQKCETTNVKIMCEGARGRAQAPKSAQGPGPDPGPRRFLGPGPAPGSFAHYVHMLCTFVEYVLHIICTNLSHVCAHDLHIMLTLFSYDFHIMLYSMFILVEYVFLLFRLLSNAQSLQPITNVFKYYTLLKELPI